MLRGGRGGEGKRRSEREERLRVKASKAGAQEHIPYITRNTDHVNPETSHSRQSCVRTDTYVCTCVCIERATWLAENAKQVPKP